MKKVFVDTDIALDLLFERNPHHAAAELLFSKAERGELKIFMSSIAFCNISYFISKNYSNPEARNILQKFRLLINILSVDEQIIDISLSSAFHDNEDAIQYHVAVKNKVDILLTRNLKDFKKSSIPVSTAASFLHT
jgi:predicted nucleic acid-binding protein